MKTANMTLQSHELYESSKMFSKKSFDITWSFQWFARNAGIFGEHGDEFEIWAKDDLAMRYLNGEKRDTIIYGFDYEHQISPIIPRFLVYKNLPTKFRTYYKIQLRFNFWSAHVVKIEYRIGDHYTNKISLARNLSKWVKPYKGECARIDENWMMDYDFFIFNELNKDYSLKRLEEIKKEIATAPDELTLRWKWAQIPRR